MVKGKSGFSSKFQEELNMFLHGGSLGGSPYYPDFDILKGLAEEVSQSISIKIQKAREELSQEEDDVACSLSEQYRSLMSNYHDLTYKSIFIMVYSSFENCLQITKELLFKQFIENDSTSENPERKIVPLLSFLLRKRKFRFNDLLDLFSGMSLLEIETDIGKRVKTLNKIRNVITHNDSIVQDTKDNKGSLIPAIKKYNGIEFNEQSFELRITDIRFLYSSIDVFQSILDEIYKNSEKL